MSTDFASRLIGNNSARWHAHFLDNLPVGIFRTTVEGRFVFCNRILAKMLGYTSVKELVNIPVINLYQNRKNRGDLIQEIIQKGCVSNYPVALKKQNNIPVYFLSTVKAVLDDDEMVIFLDGILIQISDLYREMIQTVPAVTDTAILTRQPKSSEQPASQQASDGFVHPNQQYYQGKLAGAVEMAGGVSHKLNQPLTLINNYLSEILSEPYNQDKTYHKIMRVQEQIHKLIDTVKKISAIKKYETMEYVAGIKIVDIDKVT
jgi:signal transduction histidine kinase